MDMGHMIWWLAGAVILGIIEVGTVDFVFLMLAFGALGASAASAFGVGLGGEVAVFSLVSVLGLLLGRPWIKARLAASTPDVKTNVHALVGAQAIVLSDTDSHDGRIRLEGEVWSARTRGPLFLPGTQVRVCAIEGATALVEAADTADTSQTQRMTGDSGAADEGGTVDTGGTADSAHSAGACSDMSTLQKGTRL